MMERVDGQLVVYSLSEDNANFGIRKEFCFKPANVSGVALDSLFTELQPWEEQAIME